MKSNIRPARFTDMDFVFDSWLKSFRRNKYAGVIPNNLYFATYRATIENLVARGAEIYVAAAEANDDHILGWLCCERSPDGKAILHYLYVKDPYLPFGIADRLMEKVSGERPGFYTFHYPQVVDAVPGWRHVPEIGRRK